MLIKSSWFFLALFLTILFLLGQSFYFPSSASQRDYHRLMAFVKPPQKEVIHLIEQQREQVSKQYLFSDGKQRKEWRLSSDLSTFHLKKNKGDLQLTELMQQIRCEMEEEVLQAKHPLVNLSTLEKPIEKPLLHKLRFIEAKEASFSYKDWHLRAQEVVVKRYLLPQQVWGASLSSFAPFMQGKAQAADLLFSQRPVFKVEKLQAQFTGKEK